MAQAGDDTNWFATIRATLDDHASLIDKSQSVATSLSLPASKADAKKAFTLIETNGLEVKTIIGSCCVSGRGQQRGP